jgi:hypothetical protein
MTFWLNVTVIGGVLAVLAFALLLLFVLIEHWAIYLPMLAPIAGVGAGAGYLTWRGINLFDWMMDKLSHWGGDDGDGEGGQW